MQSHKDDLFMDRRRLRRKLTFWRFVVLLIIAGVVAVSYSWMSDSFRGDHIARIRIEGTITENEELLDRLEALRKNDTVKGVIVTVDSPGGTTAGGEAIFNEIRKLAEQKPTVAQVGTLATSAGYMVATATDHIVSRESSIVGSIGVLVQVPNVSGLMDKVGVSMDTIKSSPLKAEPSPFNPTTDEERDMIRLLVMDSYDWFVDLVVSRRPLSREEVLAIADGSIFTGRQALQRKMVDSLGGVDEAKAKLVELGVNEDLSVIEWKPEPQYNLSVIAGLSKIWLNGLGGADLISRLTGESIFLDGLISVWQPETNRLGD